VTGPVDRDIAALRTDLDTIYRNHEIPSAQRQLPPPQPRALDRARIVVIGEVNAGKTSLINAVLARPELLPVTQTRQFLAVGAGAPEQALIHLVDGRTTRCPPDQLAGLLQHDTDTGTDIDHIDLMLDDAFLANLTLFDTPGVGGLDPETTSATLSTLDGATALVVACSAGEKISIAERDFLVAATRRIDHIVFVLTKTDLTDDGGEANLRENAEAIKRRLAPEQYASITFLAFSAVLADEGTLGDALSLEESGVLELRQCLTRIAINHSTYAQRNSLREIKESISTAYRVLAQRRSRLQVPHSPDGLTDIATRLTTLKRRRDTWRTLLARHVEEASFRAADDHERHLQQLRTSYDDRLTTAKTKEEMASIADDLVEDLRQWQLDTIASVHQQVVHIADDLASGLGAIDPDGLTAQLADPQNNAADCLAAASTGARNAAEGMTAVQSTYMGTMMAENIAKAVGGLVGGATAGAAVGMPFMIPLGIGWYMVQRYFRNRHDGRAELTRRVRDALSDASRLISSDTQRRYRRASWAIVDAIDAAIDDAIAAAEAEKRVLNDAAVDRRKELDRIDKLDSTLRPLQERWHSLHSSLTALTAAP